MDRSLFVRFVNRDGEMISLCRYSHCMEKECECKYSSNIPNPCNESARSSAVSLQLHRGFYHDRYSEIAKVPFYFSRTETVIYYTVLKCYIQFLGPWIAGFIKMFWFLINHLVWAGFTSSSHSDCSKRRHRSISELVANYCTFFPVTDIHIQYLPGTSFSTYTLYTESTICFFIHVWVWKNFRNC